MLRSAATLARSFKIVPISRSSYNTASSSFRNVAPIRQLSQRRTQVLPSLSRPTVTSLLYATKSDPPPPYDYTDTKEEAKIAAKPLTAHPEVVSAESSVRHVFEHGPTRGDNDEMLGGIKADLKTIKETFALTEVPRESLLIGAAGVLPYAATSLSTVYLAYDINHAESTGNGILFSPETAHQLLDLITPIQIGYGAVVRNQYFQSSKILEAHAFTRLFRS